MKMHPYVQAQTYVGPTECVYMLYTRVVRKVFSHLEYLENRSRGLEVTWQPVRGVLTVHP